MSDEYFTITLSLRSFFSDYRNRAKIFINKKVKTVSDLEDKITKIFGIKNFYLQSDSQFLPSTEDIRILGKGDIVSAVPLEPQSSSLLLSSHYYDKENSIPSDKNRNEIFGIPYQENIKKKRKKNRESKESEDLVDKIPTEKRKMKLMNKSKSHDGIVTSTPYDEDDDLDSVFIFKGNEKDEILTDDKIMKKHKEKKKVGLKKVKHTDTLQEDIGNETTRTHLETQTENVVTRKSLIGVEMEDCTNLNRRIGVNPKKESLNKCNKEVEKVRMESSSSDSSDSADSRAPYGKKNTKAKVSWSNSLSKNVNHVPIKKAAITNIDIDFSKFRFKPCDIGVVPIPSTEDNTNNHQEEINGTIEEATKEQQMETEVSVENCCATRSLDSLNNHINSETSSSSISGCEKINTFSKSDNPRNNESITFDKELKSSDDSDIKEGNGGNNSDSRLDNSKNNESSAFGRDLKLSDSSDITPGTFPKLDKPENNESVSFNDNSKLSDSSVFLARGRGKIKDLKDQSKDNVSVSSKDELRLKILEKLDTASSSCYTKPVVSELSSKSSEILNISPNSTKIKRRNKYTSGLTYYMDLMKKIDWDVTKSISTIGVNEPLVKESEIPKNVTMPNGIVAEKKIVSENELEKHSESLILLSESISSLSGDGRSVSSLESNFVTKRKRKRKHKKKMKLVAPSKPEKTWHSASFQKVEAAPKIHIRFDSNETDICEELEELLYSDKNKVNNNEENIKIIQNISLGNDSKQEPKDDRVKCNKSGIDDVFNDSSINDNMTDSMIVNGSFSSRNHEILESSQSDINDDMSELQQAKMRVLKLLENPLLSNNHV